MFVVVNGIIGRGINGVSGIVIKTSRDITPEEMSQPLVTFDGEIIAMDSYFTQGNGHALSGAHTFNVPPHSIVMLTDERGWTPDN